MKCFAETIFADQGNLLATPFTVSLISRRLIFAVPDQSAKNAKIMCLENLALYGSTSRRSLRVRPDAGHIWTIFPPTHCTHEYLASVHHQALASASVLLRLRPCVCVCASACPSVLLRVRPPVCVSVRAFAGRAMRAVRLRVRYKYIYSSSCRKTPVCRSCNRESLDVFSGTYPFVCSIQ